MTFYADYQPTQNDYISFVATDSIVCKIAFKVKKFHMPHSTEQKKKLKYHMPMNYRTQSFHVCHSLTLESLFIFYE